MLIIVKRYSNLTPLERIRIVIQTQIQPNLLTRF